MSHTFKKVWNVVSTVLVVLVVLLAFASINLKADQTIGGTALNLLATAIAVVISKYFSESGTRAVTATGASTANCEKAASS